MRTYATAADLAGSPWNLTLAPDEADRYLALASADVETLTATAVYATDSSQMPASAPIRQAFRDATCAQAVWLAETGDEMGVSSQFKSISLGSFSASVGAGSTAAFGGSVLAPRAVAILRAAGLLANAPRAV